MSIEGLLALVSQLEDKVKALEREGERRNDILEHQARRIQDIQRNLSQLARRERG
jgi:prefoldin subunit 5